MSTEKTEVKILDILNIQMHTMPIGLTLVRRIFQMARMSLSGHDEQELHRNWRLEM